ncbi:MAG TPA: M24 family metallopeptidase C-terminal domain-containing protein, partial [Prolixibacteraceae bacterium]|nr:M24 family metallopeptidase C-terminal domain-containing protein [Prolixibacteraceae bacterium]
IRREWNPHEIKPGMVFSNEPGIYRTGAYGIRTENMMVCVEKETTPFGRFLGFETLTLCPIDTRLVEENLLTPMEKEWLNLYHRRVRNELAPQMPARLIPFLDELTREIS